MWWFLANLVLIIHVLLFLFLGAAVVMAAMGWMRRYRKLALAFWPTMVVTLGGLAVPGCILSDLERWLRQMVAPGWSRDMSIARTIARTLTGYHPPETIFTALGVLLFSLAVYAFVRHHLRDVIARLRQGNQ